MKKKNGFTLVELLVTIALILMVLGIAIVSIIKISDAKKQEAYEQVKKQILTAAEQYLETNAYYKESITNTGSIKISLGLLVSEDYLNAVTNPITGKKLDYCNYVKVTKNDSSLNYLFVDDQEDCSSNSYVDVSEAASAPKIEISIKGTEGNDGWDYRRGDDGTTPVVTITASSTTSPIMGGISIKNGDEYVSLPSEPTEKKDGSIMAVDKSSFATTTSKAGKEVCYRVTNEAGISSTKCETKSIDVDLPSCNVNVVGFSNGTISDNYGIIYKYHQVGPVLQPIIMLGSDDVGSGIKNKYIKDPDNTYYSNYPSLFPYTQSNTNGKTVTWRGKVEDNAGNENTCSKRMIVSEYLEEAAQNTKIKYCGETTGESTTWTNGSRKITQEFNSYSLLGGTKTLGTETKTYSTTTRTAEISRPDLGLTCSVNVYVDKEKPYFSKITFDEEGYVYLSQWDSKGNVVFNKKPIKVQNVNGKYTGIACVKNVAGTFNITGYDVYAKDDHSGINNNSWEKYRTYYSLNKNKWIGAQCLKTENDNPCMIYDHIYVKDNAGNKSDDMGKLEIKLGYIGIDSFCK